MTVPIPVLLGCDVSETKVGIGVVRDDDGRPVRAAVELLDGPESVREVLSALTWSLQGYEPVFAYIEEPVRFGADGQVRAGIAVGMLWYALRRHWSAITVDLIKPDVWRSRVGIARAPKALSQHQRRAWYKARAVDEAEGLGFELPLVGVRVLRPSDDAAEGALLARAAWVDLEAGRGPRRVNREAVA